MKNGTSNSLRISGRITLILTTLAISPVYAGVEVLLATQSGICGPDVHIHHPTFDSRRPSDHEHNSRGVEGREDGAGR
jgi:hypothetical protein